MKNKGMKKKVKRTEWEHDFPYNDKWITIDSMKVTERQKVNIFEIKCIKAGIT